ncbi:MAG: hypothetical protein HYX66_01835 [Ignavibacteria bacterium]|nr:hypothetical protein [Ignavibacteria bacterium]
MNSIQIFMVFFVISMASSMVPVESFGQLSSNRALNLQMLSRQRAVYDSSTSMHQVRYSYLNQLPPLLTSMPIEQLISYIAVDSILRTNSRKNICSWIQSQNGWNDTLKVLSKYYYTVVDKDPGRFAQYTVETRLKRVVDTSSHILRLSDTSRESSISTGRYRTSFSSIEQVLLDKLVEEWPDSSTRRAFRAIITSDIILRVHILSIDSVVNKLTQTPMYSFATTCFVLDTIKGKILPGVSDLTAYEGKFDSTSRALTVPLSTLRFEYLPILYPEYLESNSASGSNIVRDSMFANEKGEFAMHTSQECIVFLSFMNPLVDDNYDYFNLSVNHFANGGALAIDSSTVKDPNMVWSVSGVLSVEEFYSEVDSIINIIMNGT